MSINKAEMVAKMAAKTELTQRDAERSLNAALEVITETLAAGDDVQIKGFGVFERRVRSARSGHNPKTKERIEIPESVAPAFRPGKLLKDAVAQSKQG